MRIAAKQTSSFSLCGNRPGWRRYCPDRPGRRFGGGRHGGSESSKIYLDGDGTPQGTVLVAFYERYREEKGWTEIAEMEAIRFAKYLLAHLEEFQAELNDYTAIKWPDPPKRG